MTVRASLLYAPVLLSLALVMAVPMSVGAQPAEPAAEPPAVDSSELDQAYAQAMDAFAAQDWATAAAGFDDVAARAVDAGRRAAATALAAEAHRRADAAAAPPPPGDALSPPPPAGSPPAPTEPVLAGPVPPPPLAGSVSLEAEDEDDARWRFLTTTTTFGLFFWGWSAPFALDITDERAFIATYMLIGAGSFFVPFIATMDTRITDPEASLSGAGGGVGLVHGFLAYVAFAGLEDSLDTEAQLRTLYGMMGLFSLAELTGGYLLAHYADIDKGQAVAMGSGLLFGLGWTLGLEFIIEGDTWADSDGRVQLNHTVLLLGSLAGGAGAYFLADARTWTDGDAQAVSIVGLFGAYAGLLPTILFEIEEERLVAGLLVAGSVGGLILGDVLMDGLDLSEGEAGVVALGGLGGGALGAGLGFLMTTHTTSELTFLKTLFTSSVLGYGGGLALTFALIDPKHEGQQSSDGAGFSAQLAPMPTPEGGMGLGLVGSF